jgi:hypothetical protein
MDRTEGAVSVTVFSIYYKIISKLIIIYLWEFSVCSECRLRIVECSSLHNCSSIWSFLTENLWSSPNIVISYHVFFPLKLVFLVRDLLLKHFICRPSQEVLVLLRCWPHWSSIVEVLKFRFPHCLVRTTGSEDVGLWFSSTSVIALVSEIILTWIDVLVTYCIAFEAFKCV